MRVKFRLDELPPIHDRMLERQCCKCEGDWWWWRTQQCIVVVHQCGEEAAYCPDHFFEYHTVGPPEGDRRDWLVSQGD